MADLFHELDRVNRTIDAVRADPERVGELMPLLDERARIKAAIDATADPGVEISALEKELEGLRALLEVPIVELGLARTINDGGSTGSTGQATSAYPVAAVNRSVHNDATGTARSRNDAMQRVAWIEQRLAELRSS